jgi:hypothetical protein
MRLLNVRILFVALIASFALHGQTSLWRDHLSYAQALDLGTDGQEVTTAAPSGLFTWNNTSGELQTRSKVNGLTGSNVTAMAVVQGKNLAVVGYASGRIDLVYPARVETMVDLENATGVGPSKQINRIVLRGDTAWMATDFGVVVALLSEQIILDSYTFGPGGTPLEVYDLEVDASTVYTATALGVFTGNRALNLKFPSSWSALSLPRTGLVTELGRFQGETFVAIPYNPSADSIWRWNGTSWQNMPNQNGGQFTDLHGEGAYLIAVSTFNASVYNTSFGLVRNITPGFDLPGMVPRRASFQPQQNLFWIASNLGLVRNKDVSFNEVIVPEGPFTNSVFALNTSDNKLWVAPGGLTVGFTPVFNNDGAFTYDFPNNWNHIPTTALSDCRDVMEVIGIPNQPGRAYVLTYGKGIFEINGTQVVNRYTQTNTGGAIGPVTVAGDSVYWTGWGDFDRNGQFWALNNQADQPLIVRRRDGSWESFSLSSFGGPGIATADVVANDLGQIWIRRINAGLVVFQESETGVQLRALNTTPGSGALPSQTVLCVTQDLDGEMWIGTNQGLAVIFSPFNIFENRPFDAVPVLVDVDGTLEEFLANEAVTAIAVDGANRKWIGTQNSGLFHVSEDGRQVLAHYTAANSPLLSNNVVALAIDPANGWVYVGTDRGIVSVRGSATVGGDQFETLEAYPNPVRPEYQGDILIRGFAANAQYKITDVAGNLVTEGVANGGQVVWDGRNLRGDLVPAGVYLIFGSNDTGTATGTGKLAIIR